VHRASKKYFASWRILNLFSKWRRLHFRWVSHMCVRVLIPTCPVITNYAPALFVEYISNLLLLTSITGFKCREGSFYQQSFLFLLPTSRPFLSLPILWTWKWRRHVSPKRLLNLNRLHGVMSQKIQLCKVCLSVCRFFGDAVNESDYTSIASSDWIALDNAFKAVMT
jgi:hypothetical protein